MKPIGEEHYAKIWAKNIECRTSQPNLRVAEAVRILRSGQRLLDIGCGDGLLGTLVQDRFSEVYGVDIADMAVERAQLRGVKARKVNLNIEGLPFDDNYFDNITCLSTLQFVYDIIFVLRECNRVLKLGGNLILTVPNMRTYRRIFQIVVLGKFPRTAFVDEGYDGGTLHYFCYHNLRDLLTQTGFKITMHKGIFCYPRILEKIPDRGWIRKFKAEFLGGEIFVQAVKVREVHNEDSLCAV